MATAQQGLGEQAVRAGHQAFNDRDRGKLMDLIAEDVAWHNGGRGPLSGTFRGREEVWEGFFAPVWEAPVRLEDHDFLDNGEHWVALADLVFDLPDGPRSWKVVEVGHYNEAGQATERWGFVEDQEGLREFIEQLMG